jgi:surface antigen
MASTTASGTPAKKKTAKAAPASTTTKTVAKPAAKKAPARATSARPARGNGAAKSHRVNPDQRRNYIEVAAYYIAERRGFVGGNEIDDWAAAEAEIDRLLSEGKLNG